MHFLLQDLIKKRSLEYKGRIVLENYKFEKLEDGEGTETCVKDTCS